MSDNIGVICYDDDDDEVFIGRDLAHAKAHSELVSGEIDREVNRIIDECYAEGKGIDSGKQWMCCIRAHSCFSKKEKISQRRI